MRNGIQSMINRHNNPLWPILAEDRLYGVLITDRFHLPKDMIKVWLRAKGIKKFIVTSNLVSIAGLAPGSYSFHGQSVVLENSGNILCKDKPHLAGSTRPMIDCMNFMLSIGGVKIYYFIYIGYKNPLNLLNAKIDNFRKKKI